MAAVAFGILSVATLEKEARFFIALFVKVMQEARICFLRELASEIVNSLEKRHQVWLWPRRVHCLDGGVQLIQRR